MKTSTGREFNDDLLEELRLQTHAEYISDLHYSPYREEALIIAEMLPRELYSEAAWADMCAYLAEDRSEATAEERE